MVVNLKKAKRQPEIVMIPSMKFVTIQGEGDPNDTPFLEDVKALYAMTYKVKMSYKRDNPPENYEPYKIYPLEGVWDLIDYSKPATDKKNLKIHNHDSTTIIFQSRYVYYVFRRNFKKRQSLACTSTQV